MHLLSSLHPLRTRFPFTSYLSYRLLPGLSFILSIGAADPALASTALSVSTLPRLTGPAPNSSLGTAAAQAPLDESCPPLLLGSSNENVNPDDAAGRTWVYSVQDALALTQGAVALDVNKQPTLTGSSSLELSGNQVVTGGDFDGDGSPDLAISASNWQQGNGRVYLLLGTTLSELLPAAPGEPLALEQVADVIFSGTARGSFGQTVTFIPDVDGDGRDELAIGAPFESTRRVAWAGAVHLFRGRNLEKGQEQLSQVQADGHFEGDTEDGGCGMALAAGLLDGDARGELVIGCDLGDVANVPSSGRVSVLWGTTLSAAPSSSSSELKEDVNLGGVTGSLAGAVLTLIPDLDGDLLPELLIGAPGYRQHTGAVYLLSSHTQTDWSPAGTIETLASARWIGLDEGERAGQTLHLVPADLDGDSAPELLIGAPWAEGLAGRIYQLSLQQEILTAWMDLRNAQVIYSGSTGDALGTDLFSLSTRGCEEVPHTLLLLGGVNADSANGWVAGGAYYLVRAASTDWPGADTPPAEATPTPTPSPTPAVEAATPTPTPVVEPTPPEEEVPASCACRRGALPRSEQLGGGLWLLLLVLRGRWRGRSGLSR